MGGDAEKHGALARGYKEGSVSQAERIGQFIRTYREKRNLTQTGLAELSGLSVESIRRYEGGKRTHFLHLYTAEKLADALELPRGSAERTTFFEIARAEAPGRRKPKDMRTRLIELVREAWVDGVLEQRLRGIELIGIQMVQHQRADPLTIQPSVDSQSQPPTEDAPVSTLHDVFVAVPHALLLLGRPGSGKTVVVLDLARHLLDCAEEDAAAPIPVVLPLASWVEDQLVLEKWIENELARIHLLPRTVCSQFLATGQLVLLLDGLDEVRQSYREACVEAINMFSRTFATRLIVCCRSSVYEALDTKLAVDAEVTLQPLNGQQIEMMLTNAGKRLATLRELLGLDVNTQMSNALPQYNMVRELATSPLMLSIMVQSYDGVVRDDLAIYGSPDAQRRHLLDLYTTRMLEPQKYVSYPGHQTRVALVWLARQLQEHDQTLFFLDQLQPGWLPSRTALLTYYFIDRIGSALVAGLTLSLGYAGTIVTYGLLQQMGAMYWNNLMFDVLVMFVIGSILGGVFGGHKPHRGDERLAFQAQARNWVFGWVWGGLLMGVAVSLLTRDIAPSLMGSLIGAIAGLLMGRPTLRVRPVVLVEEWTWSWRQMVRLLPVYVSAGVLVGLVIGLVLRQVDGLLGQVLSPLTASVTAGFLTSILASVIFGVSYRDDETKIMPNQGIWRSSRNALRSGVGGMFGGALFGVLVMVGPVSWIVTALIGGLLGVLSSGGITVVSHLALRLVIWQYTPFPLRSVRFLEHTVERGLLQRVGSGYQFLHPLIRDHMSRDVVNVSVQESQGFTRAISPHRSSRFSASYEGLGFILILIVLGLGSLLIQSEKVEISNPARPDLIIDTTEPGYTGIATANVNIGQGDTVTVNASGFISIGAFSRHVSPAGTERGGLGLPRGDATKREPAFPDGALLCRVTGEIDWRLCGQPIPFVASKQGKLEFLVNNLPEKTRSGRYLISINVVRASIRASSSSGLPVLKTNN